MKLSTLKQYSRYYWYKTLPYVHTGYDYYQELSTFYHEISITRLVQQDQYSFFL